MKKFLLLALLAYAPMQIATEALDADTSEDETTVHPNRGAKRGRNENVAFRNENAQQHDHYPYTAELENTLRYVEQYSAACPPVQELLEIYPIVPFASSALIAVPDATPNSILANFIIASVELIINSAEYGQFICVKRGNKSSEIIVNDRYNYQLTALVEKLAPYVKRAAN